MVILLTKSVNKRQRITLFSGLWISLQRWPVWLAYRMLNWVDHLCSPVWQPHLWPNFSGWSWISHSQLNLLHRIVMRINGEEDHHAATLNLDKAQNKDVKGVHGLGSYPTLIQSSRTNWFLPVHSLSWMPLPGYLWVFLGRSHPGSVASSLSILS